MTPQETASGLPVGVWESLAEAWVGGGLLHGWGHLSIAVHAWDLLKEVAITFITSTLVWPEVNNREGRQLHPSTENLIKDLLIMALPIRTIPSFPLNPSLPSGSFHKPLILLHQKADRVKSTATQSQKMNQPNHIDHSLVYETQ